jgi:hypothetical protein
MIDATYEEPTGPSRLRRKHGPLGDEIGFLNNLNDIQKSGLPISFDDLLMISSGLLRFFSFLHLTL